MKKENRDVLPKAVYKNTIWVEDSQVGPQIGLKINILKSVVEEVQPEKCSD